MIKGAGKTHFCSAGYMDASFSSVIGYANSAVVARLLCMLEGRNRRECGYAGTIRPTDRVWPKAPYSIGPVDAGLTESRGMARRARQRPAAICRSGGGGGVRRPAPLAF